MPRFLSAARVAGQFTALTLLLAAVPASASAAGWTCEAKALSFSPGGGERQAPVVANAGGAPCTAAQAGGRPPLPLPLPGTGGLLTAETRLDGPADSPAAQTAFAAGGLGELVVGSASLPLPPPPDFSDVPALDLPGIGTLDIKPALQALVQAPPNLELLRVNALRAEVTGSCVSGVPRLRGTSNIAGVFVNGTEIGVDKAVTESVRLLDSQSIDPSNVDVSKIVGPPGVDLTPLQAQIQPLLDALPTIEIPGEVARVRLVPGERTELGGKLTQHALDVDVALAGRPVLDLTLGEASVGSAEVSCGGVADVALQCTRRRIVLIDTFIRGHRTFLEGVAARRFQGRRVRIRSGWDNRTVARPRVGRDGTFRALAKLPPASVRFTNDARYRASIGREKSLDLKLTRRMVVRRMFARDGEVTIAGRVVRPLGSPVQTVVVTRRVSCAKREVVKRFKPRSDGSFRVSLPAPGDGFAAAYRMATRVRKFADNPKLYPTFTLPRYVDLGR
jgi:hypothetical protein